MVKSKKIMVIVFLLLQGCSDNKTITNSSAIEDLNDSNQSEVELIDELKGKSMDFLYQINDIKYKVDSLPMGYITTSGEARFHFLKTYITYKIVLETLEKEQEKYKNKIKKNRKIFFEEIEKKGGLDSELNSLLLSQKIAIETIAEEFLVNEDKNLSLKIEEFYKTHKSFYIYPNTVEISAINSKNKEELESIISKLKKDKVTTKRFSSFSKRYSTSPVLKRDSGYVGKISKQSANSKLFTTLWEGNTTQGFFEEIFDLNSSFSVFYIHKKEKAFTQSLEKEKDRIQKHILRSKIEAWLKTKEKEITKVNKIIIYDDFKNTTKF